MQHYYASPNHKKNFLHIMLILAFLSGIVDNPKPANAQTPSPGELVFYHTDHLGSTTAITDATGRVLQLLEYDPWGQVTKDIGDNYAHYRYTGQEYDPEIGLYNYKARLYAPAIGRFISPDAIVPYPANPQSLNRYSYVINNPQNFIDPSGHDFWSDLWGGVKHLGHQFEKHVIRPIVKGIKQVARDLKKFVIHTSHQIEKHLIRPAINFTINFINYTLLGLLIITTLALFIAALILTYIILPLFSGFMSEFGGVEIINLASLMWNILA